MEGSNVVDREQRLLLVRHAWAGDRMGHAGDDRIRPLDERGRDQARRLPEHLRTVLGDRLRDAVLLSSPFDRCVQTLEPLAAELGTTIVRDERLAEVAVPLRSRDGWPDAAWYGARALAAVDDLTTQPGLVIACSHGEVLPALLAALAGRDGRVVPTAFDLTAKALEKGAAWLVSGDGNDIVEVAAPDAAPAATT